MLAHVQIDVDAARYDHAVAFWAAALGATGTRPGVGPYTHLLGPRGLLGVHLQRLDAGEPRVHLDLATDDPAAEAERLLAAGASDQGQGECRVLADPGGNLLCLCQNVPEDHLRTDAVDEGARLHVLVIDVASEHVAATARFWGEVFGIPAEHLPAPYDAYWRVEGVPVPGGPLRLLIQDVGPGAAPRIHLDLHVADEAMRDAEVGRLRSLGAEVVAEGAFSWTVLRDPVGTVLCVVPDA